MQTPRREKIYFLEGLRGAGAIAVMVGHLLGAFFPATAGGVPEAVHNRFELPLYNWPILHVLYDGGFAVLIFFVLSGYVLTQNPAAWKKSAVKRFPRLMIPAFASIVFAYVLLKFGFMFNQAAAPISKSIWLGYFYAFPADFVSALYQGLIGSVLLGHVSYNTSLWTIAFEFYGALLVIALAVMCEPLGRWRIVVYLCAALLAVSNFGTAGVYYAAMIFGIILTGLHRDKQWPAIVIVGLVSIAFMFGGLNDGSFYGQLATHKIEINGMTINTVVLSKCIGAVALVSALLRSNLFQKLLSTPPFRFLGRISFSVYLLHVPIICSFGCWSFIRLSGHLRYNAAALATIAISIATVMIASVIFERFIDRASISIAGSMYQRLIKSKNQTIANDAPGRIDSAPGINDFML